MADDQKNYSLNDCVSAVMGLKNIVKRQEDKLASIEQSFGDLCAKFAYYWYDEKKTCFAVVKELDPATGKADLICFGDHVSGDVEILKKREMVNFKDDQWPKLNRWQPIVIPETRKLLQILAGQPVEELVDEPTLAHTAAS